jgi:hypothetical protein
MKTCLLILLAVSLLVAPAAWASAPRSVVVCPEPDVITWLDLKPSSGSCLLIRAIKARAIKASPEEHQKLLDDIDWNLRWAKKALERGDRSAEVIRWGLEAVGARAILLDDKEEIHRLNEMLRRLLKDYH